jgi:quinoprotein glucose dehydrogenase
MLSPLGVPCTPTPWGVLAAVDLNSGRVLWQSNLGTTEDIAPLGLTLDTGTPTLGGPIVTDGGLVFIGAAMDRYLRAFDAATGAELWRGRLPASGIATPMTYAWQGRQYVVIAAGGHGEAGLDPGDAIVAFALPGPGEPRRSLWDRSVDQPGGRFWAVFTLLIAALAALMGLTARVLRARRAASGK